MITCVASAVERPGRNPLWLLSRTPCFSVQFRRRLAVTLARMRLIMANRHTSREFPGLSLSPCLNRGTISPIFTMSSHLSALVSNRCCTSSMTFQSILAHDSFMYRIRTLSRPGEESFTSYMAWFISSIDGVSLSSSLAAMRAGSLLQSGVRPTAFWISCGGFSKLIRRDFVASLWFAVPRTEFS